jgi:hypothetical protein
MMFGVCLVMFVVVIVANSSWAWATMLHVVALASKQHQSLPL